MLRFASGAVGTFLLSDATPSPWTWEQAIGESPRVPAAGQNTHRLIGTRAALEFPELVLWRQREGDTGWHQPIDSEPIVTERVDAYVEQCAHFCAVVRGKETPRVDATDAARTLTATLAVLESAAAGRPVLL